MIQKPIQAVLQCPYCRYPIALTLNGCETVGCPKCGRALAFVPDLESRCPICLASEEEISIDDADHGRCLVCDARWNEDTGEICENPGALAEAGEP